MRVHIVSIASALSGLIGLSSAAAQGMRLLPADVELTSTLHEARVWVGPKVPGHAGKRDLVSWTSATGDLAVVIVGHPTRSGLEGEYGIGGDCTMRLTRPDLAGAALTIAARETGPDVFVFWRRDRSGVSIAALRAVVVPSVGCGTGTR